MILVQRRVLTDYHNTEVEATLSDLPHHLRGNGGNADRISIQALWNSKHRMKNSPPCAVGTFFARSSAIEEEKMAVETGYQQTDIDNALHNYNNYLTLNEYRDLKYYYIRLYLKHGYDQTNVNYHH